MLLLVPVQDSSQPVMTADEIVRRLEQLDAALRVVESEGRELEEKIRKGISAICVSRASKTAAPPAASLLSACRVVCRPVDHLKTDVIYSCHLC